MRWLPSSAQPSSISLQRTFGYSGPSEHLLGTASSGVGHGIPTDLVTEDGLDSESQSRSVAGRNHLTDTVLDDFRHAPSPGADDGRTTGHGLDEGEAE